MSKKVKIILAIVAGIILINMIVPKPDKNSPEAKEQARIDSVNAQIDAENKKLSDAYYHSLVLLKKSLKDPDSFEEIEHKEYYVKQEKGKNDNVYAQVIIAYRAKNSFGGYVVSRQLFDYDENFNLLASDKMD